MTTQGHIEISEHAGLMELFEASEAFLDGDMALMELHMAAAAIVCPSLTAHVRKTKDAIAQAATQITRDHGLSVHPFDLGSESPEVRQAINQARTQALGAALLRVTRKTCS